VTNAEQGTEMKTCTKKSFVVPMLVAALCSALVGQVMAQTFTAVHTFTQTRTNSSGVYTNSDGANPYAGLVAAGNETTWYGTASLGGTAGYGTVFAVSTDGKGFTNLHNFTGASDGATPWAGLILSSNTLYGTTYYGGNSGNGAVFAINTDGTGFTVLHSFTATDASEINGDGAYPNGGLILSGKTLYGTASRGGSSGIGSVFAVNTDGSGFTNLHSLVVADGAVPVAGLVVSANTLYGTATRGGLWDTGTLFSVKTDGSRFTVLHSFEPTQNPPPPPPWWCPGCVCMGFCGGGG
jgi:uncharacterized repeat protein (TIGR03803 family)